MITVQRERIHDLWNEAYPILLDGWNRFENFLELPPDIDRDRYEILEEAGLLRTFTARGNEAALVGYAVFILGQSIRRKYLTMAQQDVLHTAPGPLRLAATLALVNQCEQALRDEGVGLVYHSSPKGLPFGRLLQLKGYEHVSDLYAKRLR